MRMAFYFKLITAQWVRAVTPGAYLPAAGASMLSSRSRRVSGGT